MPKFPHATPATETPRVLDITIHNKCRCVDKAEMDKRQRTKSTTTCQEKKTKKIIKKTVDASLRGICISFLAICHYACAQFWGIRVCALSLNPWNAAAVTLILIP